MSRRMGGSLLAAMISLLMSAASALAQANEGRILGTVTDSQGKVVVGAKVVVTNAGTNAARTLQTNHAGDYVAPNLQPGLYTITAEVSGFKKVVHANVRLEVGSDVRIDFRLVPGDIAETVRVTAEAPLITTTNDNIGGTLSNKEINDLPLNGRDYQNLVVLRPGVVRFPGGGFESIAANGMRPEDNNFVIEGSDDNDPYYSGNIINAEGVQGTPGSILPIDAIQEFNTEENPPPDVGWKPGVTINIGIKSGTNSLHGTAYGFERNNALDARNWFNTEPSPHTALRQHQFGGTVGGPIKHDKTFFFGAYEGVRGFISNVGSTTSPATVSVPSGGGSGCSFISTGDCTNSIPDALADLQAGGITPNAQSLNLIGKGAFTGNGPFPGIFPVNPVPDPANPSTITTGFPNVNRSDTGVVKVDHHFSTNNALSAHYLIGDSKQTEEDFTVLQARWLSTSSLRAQVFGVSWTWTPSGSWVNEARFGFNNFWQKIQVGDHTANPLTTYGLNTGVTNPLNFGLPEIDITGFQQLGSASGWPLFTTPNRTFQISDGVSYTRGVHTFKFGGEIRRGSTDNLRDRTGKGRIQFFGGGTPQFPPDPKNPGFTLSTALEDFLAGFPGQGKIFVGDSRRHVHFWSFAWYVADDWRVTPHLTVNLGLRYELNTVIKEGHNLLGNFDPAVGLQQVGVNISSPYNGDHNNFAPRVGIAWDPWGLGKTVFRAGAGVNYEIPHLSIFLGQNGVDNATTPGLNDIPTGANGSNISGTINTTGLTLNPCSGASIINCVNYGDGTTPIFTPTADCVATPCDILGVTRHLRTPYVISWNLNVQHALTNSTAIQVGYVGNHGVKLYSVRDINQADPAVSLANGCAQFDLTCEQKGRPFNAQFPFLQFINFLENGYTSSYNGLQITATQKVWHGLNFLLGYTWAHSIDDATNNRALPLQDSTRPNLERSSSDFDVRHRLTLALTYALPSKKVKWQLLEGWQVNSILTVQGGTPWTVLDGVLNGDDISLTSEFADRWDFFGNPNEFKATPAGIQFFSGTTNSTCAGKALAVDGGVLNGPTTQSLATFGCYAAGNSVMIPPALGTFGTMGRNLFRGPRLDNLDFSLVKDTRLGERVKMQFRAEFFNITNHPHFANPEAVTLFDIDPSASNFGCACATPDVAAANPVVGTGGPRNIQLGLKFIF
jgi:Carboxypeptidase regulatory-like domain